MKSIVIAAAVFAAVSFAACNGGNGNNDSVDSAKDINDSMANAAKDSAKTDTSSLPTATMPVDKDDADFAVKAANGGMMEVALGQLAATNAKSQRVKDFGAMMVKDHTEGGEKLKQLAQQKNIALPATLGNDEQKHVNDMQKKTGADFDKAYMNMMLDDHKDDIKEFQKAGNNCKDADLKTFALSTLPVLQKHLDSAKAITGKQ